MAKIQRLFESSLPINFLSPQSELSLYHQAFLSSDLGKIYQAIPWQDLVKSFGLKNSHLGRPGIFSPQGKLALLFLKHYSQLSDHKLIEQLNGNIYYQLFCGILIPPDQPLKNGKIVSSIRMELSERLCIEDTQLVLAHYWKPYLKEQDKLLTDATCYESALRFPTDLKLLWESVSWSYDQLKWISKNLGLRMPRSKYLKWAARYQSYSRKRKARIKEKRSLRAGLLRLLQKLLAILEDRLVEGGIIPEDYPRFETVSKVLDQQWAYFFEGIKPKGRIVSLAKPYLRPIVRGKEIKAIEFGAKVNKIQIDGINFIEHLSFETFNEGTRLKASVRLGQKLFGKVRVLGADQIYATNANRKYCTKRKIRTDFRRKGRPGKFEDQRKLLAKMITKERASRLEGSFGNEKNHYLLKAIRARTKKSEILWIFFGIHTANALNIGRRMHQKSLKKAA